MLPPGTVLQQRYRVVRPLKQGGMGTVYEAVDERLDSTVALKECHFTEEPLRKQFEREARLLARLRHPALTKVIDHFSESAGQFLVMEFIPGEDLSEMIVARNGPFPQADVLVWADQLLDALDYLHTHEPPIVHRDIKPMNLKRTARGQVILLDFGLAKGFADQRSRITTGGSIFGYTPNYAPLEQIQGTGTDPRSDLYSLAATLFHLLTATAPPDALTRITAVANDQPDSLPSAHALNPRVSPAVSAVIEQAMSQNRGKRPATANHMRQMLRDAALDLVPQPSDAAASATVVDPLATLAMTSQDLQAAAPSVSEQVPPAKPIEPEPSAPHQTKADTLPQTSPTPTPARDTGAGERLRQNTAPRMFDTYAEPQRWRPSDAVKMWFAVSAGLATISLLIGAAAYFILSPKPQPDEVAAGAQPLAQSNSSAANTALETRAGNVANTAVRLADNAAALPTPATTQTPKPTSTPKPTPTPHQRPTTVVTDDDAPPPVVQQQPPPEAPRRNIISGGVLNGKAISKPQPAYPPIAKAARASGTVTVQIVVDESGRVISASAVSGHPLLQQAAVAAARAARFSPTILSGQPVKVSGVITYNFVLQ